MSQELTLENIDRMRAELTGNWDHDLTPPEIDALCAAARAWVEQDEAKHKAREACRHENSIGSASMGSDGSGHSSWYCPNCGKSGESVWPSRNTDEPPYVVEREEVMPRAAELRTDMKQPPLAQSSAGVAPTASPSAELEREMRCRKCGKPLPMSNPTTLCINCQYPFPSARKSYRERFPDADEEAAVDAELHPWAPDHPSPSACVSGEGLEEQLRADATFIDDWRFMCVPRGDRKGIRDDLLKAADALAQCRTQEAACRSEVERLHEEAHQYHEGAKAENIALRAEVERLKAQVNRFADMLTYEQNLRRETSAKLAAKQDYIDGLEDQYNSYIMQHSPETVPACTVTALHGEVTHWKECWGIATDGLQRANATITAQQAELASLRETAAKVESAILAATQLQSINEALLEQRASLRARVAELEGALEDLVSDCEEYSSINNLHNADGGPATNHAMRRALAALTEAEAK